MKSKDLFEAIGGTDEELVERCRQNKTHRPLWLKWGALAACLCLAVAGVLTIPGVLPIEQDQAEAPKHNVAVPIINGSGYEGSAASYVIPEPGTTLFI
ncbi:MAG: hypothetical protein GX847_07655, partial [Clostridiales bacterium]|nr:hypothetical protein [Clostridiales bacterium]